MIIEQDADLIMLMYRDDYYDKETEYKDITENQIAKHRNGPVGMMKLRFLKEYGKFVEGLKID
ncbi:DNA helicase [Bacillus pseudomycoides]|nr:DNA helicase [Bacillus pseudomycoides]